MSHQERSDDIVLHDWKNCPVGNDMLNKQKSLEETLGAKLDKVSSGVETANKQISELNSRVLNPDDGLVVSVTSILRWRRAVDKALWIIFGILATAVLGGFFGWMVEKASDVASHG